MNKILTATFFAKHERRKVMSEYIKLNELLPGERAEIIYMESIGSMRRRLFDLGFFEHGLVECVGESPLGDPRAYLIRGSVVALRNKDCGEISVSRIQGER